MTFTIPSQGINGEGGYVGPNSVSLDGSPFVDAYCTDLFRSIGVNDSYPGSVQPLSALPGGDVVARLFTADTILGSPTPTSKAALQLAIWDVVESARFGLAPWTRPGSGPGQRETIQQQHIEHPFGQCEHARHHGSGIVPPQVGPRSKARAYPSDFTSPREVMARASWRSRPCPSRRPSSRPASG